MNDKVNALNWFEIAVSDINRAKKFYEEVFGIKMEVQEMMGMHMAFFPADMSSKVGGALVQSNMHKPSVEGAVIYLNANPDLSVALGNVEKAGGKVAMPKMHINDETGYMGFFIDSEGNKVGMHSNK
ncbi:MAG: Glyoxalase/bleomycin resistance protein/dioxygenase [Bacteroidetes bacterium]|nr:Glyoxalase/bleomycin resistance protein/dioxygenase [Bacteroidota bacterium]